MFSRQATEMLAVEELHTVIDKRVTAQTTITTSAVNNSRKNSQYEHRIWGNSRVIFGGFVTILSEPLFLNGFGK